MPRNSKAPFQTVDPPEVNKEYEDAFLASLSAGPDEQGHYRTLVYPTNSKNYDDAKLAVQRLHRPRYRQKFKKRGKTQYGLHCEIITLPDGTYGVKYHATTRAAALQFMMNKDKSEWAF